MRLSLITIISTSCALYIPFGIESVKEAVRNGVLIFNKGASVDQQFLSPGDTNRNFEDFGEWLQWQKEVSFKGILQNIGGTSTVLDTKEVYEGVVIASTSKQAPNYFFQWVRDSALTIKSLIDFIEDKGLSVDPKIFEVIESYIENSYHLQRLDNPSGNFDDLNKSGLGEPKFLTTNEPFNQKWGRPQGDGPGLRAITIIKYLCLLKKLDISVSNSFLKSTENVYEQIIKPDLTYVLRNWRNDSFDLWEEVSSVHFFNAITQLTALKYGIQMAEQLEDYNFLEELNSSYSQLEKFVVSDAGFTQPGVSHLIETPHLLTIGQRSGLDSAILLGVLHAHDLPTNLDNIPFNVDDGRVLSTLYNMVNDMKFRYPINRKSIGFSVGVGLGRYPEDIYDGYATSEGNPWFLATASAAEIVYKLIHKSIEGKGNLVIDASNRDFYSEFLDLVDSTQSMSIPYGSQAYQALMRRLFNYSDSFLQVIKDHVDHQGHMSEQFNKYTGYMQGASELTWSYSAVWSAIRWRERALASLI